MPPPAHSAEPSASGLVAAELHGSVGLARLNRPEARNALSPDLIEELGALLERWDDDPDVTCIVIAGGDDWFAAGADIKSMATRSFQEGLISPSARFWPRLARVRTPLVAAVSGYALGGGCELALACDMIVASESAEFGQPEILLGIIPGGGGTQRLARVVGKQRAMELILTGRRIDAGEAQRLGSSTSGAARRLAHAALELAAVIASRPPLAVRFGKQAVLPPTSRRSARASRRSGACSSSRWRPRTGSRA